MKAFVNCNTSGLAVYNQPLNQKEVEHLFRRCAFGASKQVVDQSVGRTAVELVSGIINDALAVPTLPAYPWSTWNNSNYPEDDDLASDLYRAQVEELRIDYAKAMRANGLRDRMSFFWSNHFVTELDVYNCAAFLHEYVTCLQRNALGNFKTFVSEIGLTGAMLRYLDGSRNRFRNVNTAPNENYARELYELFTLGEGTTTPDGSPTYTEADILETAKALTGYTDNGDIGCNAYSFNPNHFWEGEKTIFGQTGNWGYDDVINLLFDQRPTEIARFIVGKLYQYLVHPDISEGNVTNVINGLADTFVANNFQLAPVLNQLLISEHFFDEESIGVIIKSPIDLFFEFSNETGFSVPDNMLEQMVDTAGQLNQTLFDPVDVAGWQRDRDWINTNIVIGRWLSTEYFNELFFAADPESFRTLALELVGPANQNTSNPRIVVEAFVNHFTPKGLLTEQDFQNALDVFTIDDIPENYYSPDFIEDGLSIWILSVSMEVPTQVRFLLNHLIRQPEFQLK